MVVINLSVLLFNINMMLTIYKLFIILNEELDNQIFLVNSID